MSFFHQSTLQRKRQNRIMKIKIDNGQWVDNPKLIRSTLEDHFKCFLPLKGREIVVQSWNVLSHLLQ